MPTSNTEECFLEFVGQKVTGIIMGPELTHGRTVDIAGCLVFEDGRGLCWNSNGTFYVERKAEVDRAIEQRRKELEETEASLNRVLAMTGTQRAGVQDKPRGKKDKNAKSKASARNA